ncbi:hypothetical protein BCR41DRAFT_372561 [Lobosporangium transversale]|uniref:Uncharacterized protein n=1 Tax=Lobosporangium transversale TaxID=64571 RepID=A0A1Y2GGV2_9FUNG|nr:hypothetical protein BCR41DRAFT_372561 [Lobosporangium transversale]ORZ10383.1 hypothetical protein BCR41DRAFT_372561 [Lobosporangium transversale]|eukprot:XP_021879290.1 hypothetical protein BCR41DRAFT_372561 [Lobosporangium transversale]
MSAVRLLTLHAYISNFLSAAELMSNSAHDLMLQILKYDSVCVQTFCSLSQPGHNKRQTLNWFYTIELWTFLRATNLKICTCNAASLQSNLVSLLCSVQMEDGYKSNKMHYLSQLINGRLGLDSPDRIFSGSNVKE